MQGTQIQALLVLLKLNILFISVAFRDKLSEDALDSSNCDYVTCVWQGF